MPVWYYFFMYFRNSFSKKYTAPILQLVEGIRTAKGVGQQLVISLGRMEVKKEIRKATSSRIENILMGQESLIEVPEEIEKLAQTIAAKIRVKGKWENAKRINKINTSDDNTPAVFADQITHTHGCELGPELVAYQVFQQLQIDRILKESGFSDLDNKIATINILSRLINPGSEANLTAWVKNTGLPELLDIDPLSISKDRYYRITDKLILKRDMIEQKLAKIEEGLFKLNRNILLYDLTNTYFEGECANHSKAAFGGHSKEKRNDCPQLSVGLVVDENGFALKHKIFAGNTHDSKTVIEIINELKNDLKDNETPIVMVDAGMSCEENLKEIKSAGFEYLVMLKRSQRNQHAEILDNEDLFEAVTGRAEEKQVFIYKETTTRWWTIKKTDFNKLEGVDDTLSEIIWTELVNSEYLNKKGEIMDKFKIAREIKLPPELNNYKSGIEKILRGAEYVLLYCKSEGREKKETAIKSKSRQKLEESLSKLEIRIQNGRLKDENKINQAVGRLKERYHRAARFYEISTEKKRDIIKLTWKPIENEESNESQEGAYIIKSSKTEMNAEEIWTQYVMLTRVENAFRNLKSNLGLRPNYHTKEHRIDSHIFITILAYHVLQAIEYTLRAQGDKRTWPTIKQLLETHCYSTIVVPTVNGPVINTRKAGMPDAEQKNIYTKLGISYSNLPVKKIIA